MADSHRGPEFAGVQTWVDPTPQEQASLRRRDDATWLPTREHLFNSGAPITDQDATIGIHLLIGMRHLESVSVDFFGDYWLHQHARFTAEAAGVSRYSISLATPDAYLAAQPVFDGIAEIWFRSQSDFEAYLASPLLAELGPDMENFVSPTAPFYSAFTTTGDDLIEEATA